MPSRDRLDRILALARRHRPGLVLVDKHDARWMRAVGRAVSPLMPGFMDRVTTVIGDRVYLPGPPDRFDPDELARTLAHELVHQLDQQEHGAAFYLSYAAWPMPVGRTRRAHWERRAYAVDLMLAHHDGGPRGLAREASRVAELFSGPMYGWMWAGSESARSYVQVVADEVAAGTLQLREPYRQILRAWDGEEPRWA
ncbi:MAG: hypothetical protein ABMA64_20960 [Myxococcota bacterium]